METVKLYRRRPVHAGDMLAPYWDTAPASNEVHPDTGLEYDEWTDDGPVEFVLPEHVHYDDDMHMLWDDRENRYLEIDGIDEPSVCILQKTVGRTLLGECVEGEKYFNVRLRRA